VSSWLISTRLEATLVLPQLTFQNYITEMEYSAVIYSMLNMQQTCSFSLMEYKLVFTAFSDPCLANNGGCNANADCLTVNGAVSCTCRAGYSGDGYTCTGGFV